MHELYFQKISLRCVHSRAWSQFQGALWIRALDQKGIHVKNFFFLLQRNKWEYPSKMPICFEQILNYFQNLGYWYQVDLTEYPIISKVKGEDQSFKARKAHDYYIISWLLHIIGVFILSATDSLELRLVSSAILEHTNNNISHSWLGLVIVSNDRWMNYHKINPV